MPPIYNNKSSNGFGSPENGGKPFGPKSAYTPMKLKVLSKPTKPAKMPKPPKFNKKNTTKNSWGKKSY